MHSPALFVVPLRNCCYISGGSERHLRESEHANLDPDPYFGKRTRKPPQEPQRKPHYPHLEKAFWLNSRLRCMSLSSPGLLFPNVHQQSMIGLEDEVAIRQFPSV